MFSDGFLVNDSEFYATNDPSNAHALAQLRSGETPDLFKDLVLSVGGSLSVELTEMGRGFNPQHDLPNENPTGNNGSSPLRALVFMGTGNVLGSNDLTNRHQFGSVTTCEIGTPNVDASRPITAIQIRLFGVRHVRNFNMDDLGSSIVDLVGNGGDIPIENLLLSTGFPPQTISHPDLQSKTIAELGLCNSVINITLKE